MDTSLPEAAHWPLEIVRLQADILGADAGSARRDALRGDLWRLLFEALMRFLRLHSRSARSADRADLEDIAAEKALEMLSRAESGAWNLSERSAAEISGYVSKAARYGWIDFVHRSSREVRMAEPDRDERPEDGPGLTAGSTTPPTSRVESLELVHAVRDCAEALPARERQVWFFRAFYEMSSQEIAAHPRVRLKAPHVDVLVQRTREALRDCLRDKGHAVEDAPRGAFVELWALLQSMAAREVETPPPPGRSAARRME